jgi:hypothetical protein
MSNTDSKFVEDTVINLLSQIFVQELRVTDTKVVKRLPTHCEESRTSIRNLQFYSVKRTTDLAWTSNGWEEFPITKTKEEDNREPEAAPVKKHLYPFRLPEVPTGPTPPTAQDLLEKISEVANDKLDYIFSLLHYEGLGARQEIIGLAKSLKPLDQKRSQLKPQSEPKSPNLINSRKKGPDVAAHLSRNRYQPYNPEESGAWKTQQQQIWILRPITRKPTNIQLKRTKPEGSNQLDPRRWPQLVVVQQLPEQEEKREEEEPVKFETKEEIKEEEQNRWLNLVDEEIPVAQPDYLEDINWIPKSVLENHPQEEYPNQPASPDLVHTLLDEALEQANNERKEKGKSLLVQIYYTLFLERDELRRLAAKDPAVRTRVRKQLETVSSVRSQLARETRSILDTFSASDKTIYVLFVRAAIKSTDEEIKKLARLFRVEEGKQAF